MPRESESSDVDAGHAIDENGDIPVDDSEEMLGAVRSTV